MNESANEPRWSLDVWLELQRRLGRLEPSEPAEEEDAS